MYPNDKDTYIVTLNCPLETENPLIINLNPFELNLLQFIENLSGKLCEDSLSKPYLIVEKFPYKEYKTRKLSSFKQRELKKILNSNKKAYTKIKHEVEKQRKKTQIKTQTNTK